MINTVIYSGGMDSFTLLQHVIRAFPTGRVYAMTFDYGQRHAREIEYATRAIDKINQDTSYRHADVQHIVMRMQSLGGLLAGSSQTSKDVPVPHGHYAAENMKKTVVPGRNTIMLALAFGFTESKCMEHSINVEGYGTVWYGAHAGDHTIYPDCRPKYFHAMNRVMDEGSDYKIALAAPFIELTKSEILTRGLAMGLDYADTYTCYEGGEEPCGLCGACQERQEAFQQNGVADPLLIK